MLPEKSEASIRKGCWFVVRDGNNLIHIHGSNINGKESVYLNNELVSEKRNLHKKSEHEFEDKNNNSYQIEISVSDLYKGSLECKVYKNDELIKTFKTILNTAKKKQTLSLIILIVLGGISGAIISIYHLPFYYLIVLLLVIFPVYLYFKMSGGVEVKEE